MTRKGDGYRRTGRGPGRREREEQVAATFADWLRDTYGLVLDQGETGAVETREPEKDGADLDGLYSLCIMFPPDGGYVGMAQPAHWRDDRGLAIAAGPTWRASRPGDQDAPRSYDELADALEYALTEAPGIAVDLSPATAVDAVA